MEPQLTQYHKAILSYIARHKYGKRSASRILDKFQTPALKKGHIKNILKDLQRCGYIKKIELDSQGVEFLGEISGEQESSEAYKITELARSHVSTSANNTQINNFSNISNSAIANNSSNITQTVAYNDQPEDIREAIDELDAAANRKDTSALKKAFGYIADKSVDVAIALATGGLVR